MRGVHQPYGAVGEGGADEAAGSCPGIPPRHQGDQHCQTATRACGKLILVYTILGYLAAYCEFIDTDKALPLRCKIPVDIFICT
jgi:hypothetical protein